MNFLRGVVCFFFVLFFVVFFVVFWSEKEGTLEIFFVHSRTKKSSDLCFKITNTSTFITYSSHTNYNRGQTE